MAAQIVIGLDFGLGLGAEWAAPPSDSVTVGALFLSRHVRS